MPWPEAWFLLERIVRFKIAARALIWSIRLHRFSERVHPGELPSDDGKGG
jgi:hypothetical protein